MNPCSCIGVWQDETQWLKAEKREAQTGYKEQLYPHEGRQAAEEIIQKGCEVSVAGVFH